MQLLLLHAPEICAPCRDFDDRIEEVLVENDLVFKVPLSRINVRQDPDHAEGYEFTVIPTLILLEDDGTEVWRTEGRCSKRKLLEVFAWAAYGLSPEPFHPDAHNADIVFNRTYSRRREENGQREIFPEMVDRVIDDIVSLGSFTDEEAELVKEQALEQRVFPSGRWLWVGGTPWIHEQQNFSGAYNCTSTNVDSPEAFGLMMELAMMGSGTGAILEKEMVAKLPPIRLEMELTSISEVGDAPGSDQTVVEVNGDTYRIVVGDSRKGWVDAYQALIDMAMGVNHVKESDEKIKVEIDLGQIRPAGSKLKGFGGTANPIKLPVLFTKVINLLNGAVGRQLIPIEACLLIDEAASTIVAGNIRRSAGMRQFSWDDMFAASAKDGLYIQDEDGSWKVDPVRESFRMANHTRCAHKKPSLVEVVDAVKKQFASGEGAIQYVPEAVARSNRDLFSDEDEKQAFIEVYEEGYGREFLCSLIDVDRPEMDKGEKDAELDHRMGRYGLNPCGEILGSDFHCNLAEVHLNQIDPMNLLDQDLAFQAAGLQVAALLHHQFKDARYQGSRTLDPIVGVSFTGLFDFFVQAWGAEWLDWMMAGRKDTHPGARFAPQEAQYLEHWRKVVESTVRQYCEKHGLRTPNRTTTVQPAGTKSLLTGASSGWHPPKSQRFIRRITVGAYDPVAMAAIDYGYNVIPAQSALDDEGNLLDDIHDERSREWLIEVPTAVVWANKKGCDQYDLSQLSAAAQFGLYMQVQNHYTTHNTSATIEFRENEINDLAQLIHGSMGKGYISAALLARFDVDGGTFPRLPFEPISAERYEEEIERVAIRGEEATMDFGTLLARHDSADLELVAADGACTSAACIAKAEITERKQVKRPKPVPGFIRTDQGS